MRVCLLCLGAVQRIACDELVRSEECTCCPRICATAVAHMDPALLHRMNDLIQGRRITQQLLVSHLQVQRDQVVMYPFARRKCSVCHIMREAAGFYESREGERGEIRDLKRWQFYHLKKMIELENRNRELESNSDEVLVAEIRDLRCELGQNFLKFEKLWSEIHDLRCENRGLELLVNELESQVKYYDNPEDDACDTG